jgi:hypothetical protein
MDALLQVSFGISLPALSLPAFSPLGPLPLEPEQLAVWEVWEAGAQHDVPEHPSQKSPTKSWLFG